MIDASTRLMALLGNPTAHSLSPPIQNAAFAAAGVNGVYVALSCQESEVSGLIRGIALAGGGGNVTLPHKGEAARVVDEPSDLVRMTGACNTFWLEDGAIRGENTDVAGFRGAVESLLGHDASGSRVLLLGAGGAARGALLGLQADGVGEILVWNRTVERARRMVERVGAGSIRVIPTLREARDEPIDLVVNATSVGLGASDRTPVDRELLAGCGAVLDMVYRPEETEMVRQARRIGIPAADGGEMLILQGAEAFRLWWGQPAPLAAMRDVLSQVRAGAAKDGRAT